MTIALPHLQYTPIIKMATPYEKYFRPTMVTDQSGRLAEDLAEDLWDEAILELRA